MDNDDKTVKTAEPNEEVSENSTPSQETTVEGNENIEKLGKAEKGIRHYQFLLLRVALLFLILWVLFFKVIGITHMPNGDMHPRIDAGDLVMFYRLDRDVRSQDVIVIEKENPEGEEQTYISRVIAVAGDTVEITSGGRVRVNGNILAEADIYFSTPAYENYTEYPVTLGEDECFVLSDYRKDAADSRYFGVVKKDEIKGTVITIMRRTNL